MLPDLNRVAVLVATLNEAANVAATLQSLRAQDAKPGMLVLVDSHSDDGTVHAARPLVDAIYHAPRGKITAVDAGIRALPERISIVAMADADCYYPPHWLRTLVEAMDEQTVLTHGPSYHTEDLGLLESVVMAEDASIRVSAITNGGNRAARRSSYLAAPMNRNVVQTHIAAVILEEEVLWTGRMSRLGLVRFVPDAWRIHSSRRAKYQDPLNFNRAAPPT